MLMYLCFWFYTFIITLFFYFLVFLVRILKTVLTFRQQTSWCRFAYKTVKQLNNKNIAHTGVFARAIKQNIFKRFTTPIPHLNIFFFLQFSQNYNDKRVSRFISKPVAVSARKQLFYHYSRLACPLFRLNLGSMYYSGYTFKIFFCYKTY